MDEVEEEIMEELFAEEQYNYAEEEYNNLLLLETLSNIMNVKVIDKKKVQNDDKLLDIYLLKDVINDNDDNFIYIIYVPEIDVFIKLLERYLHEFINCDISIPYKESFNELIYIEKLVIATSRLKFHYTSNSIKKIHDAINEYDTYILK